MADKQELARLLAQHQSNLHKLQEQAALFGAGETPLHLLNQIDTEKQAIADIEARLAGDIEEPSAAEQYFSKGIQAMIRGDLWEAKRYFELTLKEDTFFPRAEQLLADVKALLYPRIPAAPAPVLQQQRQLWASGSGALGWAEWLILILLAGLIFGVIGGIAGAFWGQWLAWALRGAAVGAIVAVILWVIYFFVE
jgi:hypothetical protein